MSAPVAVGRVLPTLNEDGSRRWIRPKPSHVIVGSPAFVEARAACGPRLLAPPRHLTPILVAVNGVIVASAGFGDPVRADARRAIDTLRARGWKVGILSGDHPEVVASVGETLGLPREACVGGAVPEEKHRIVQEARHDGTVVMVGDGVNDAAAMAAATVGVGVHGGAEACLSTADVYLTRPGLEPLVTLTEGAARTIRVIRRNIAFSIGYNVIGATLAVTGVITPLIAAVLMPIASFAGSDAHDLMGIAFVASGTPGPFRLLIDDVRFR